MSGEDSIYAKGSDVWEDVPAGAMIENGRTARVPGRTLEELRRRIEHREATIGVIGLGYVGLPLACTIVESGLRAVGFDIDATKVTALMRGESYIRHVTGERVTSILSKARTVEALASDTSRGGLIATTHFENLRFCDAILICVPTPLADSREPDLSFVRTTTDTVAKHLRAGQLVVLESTTYPGTTDEVLRPILEQHGLVAGRDFALAFSPEREDPGNPRFSTKSIPKLVGGVTPECSAVAAALYSMFIAEVVPVSSARVAESAKLLENVFRCINIALVNELKMLFDRMGIDVWEVIEAAATKPFGFMPFYPGPGLGGHCIPIDPFYLTWKARHFDFATRFIELAGEINTNMPYYVVQRVMEELGDRGKAIRGAKILVLGIAYKKDVDDLRDSPALKLIELLESHGADVSYNDPHIPTLRTRRLRGYGTIQLDSVELTPETLGAADCVLIATDHAAYDYAAIVERSRLVVDTRNATRAVAAGKDNLARA